jgi:hypothetical protein
MIPRLGLLSLLLLALLAPPAGATWSIILVDSATGEVGIASATCLEGFDLLKALPVVVVGKGAAAAQSAIDMGAKNRKKIWDAFHAGIPPVEIIKLVKEGDLLKCSRQYGIVDTSPAAAAFTGNCAGGFKQHRLGSFGTITYAVQGNVLTGQPVIDAIVHAIEASGGLLSDRLMAGMEAARSKGGDGRCSCDPNAPTACGSPPPSFEKAAHVGFLIVARIGDADGACNGAQGCANGDYWLSLNVAGGFAADPDPVYRLRRRYAAFLERMRGRPDGVMSFALWDDPQVPGDGQQVRELQVVLVDAQGDLVGQGGFDLAVEHAPGSAGLSHRWGVVDHGDGTYTVRVQAGEGAGTDRFQIRVIDPGGRVATLYPYPELELLPSGGR